MDNIFSFLNKQEMKMLEEELQVSLFLRGTKKIVFTDAGKTLYEQTGNLLMLLSFGKYFFNRINRITSLISAHL